MSVLKIVSLVLFVIVCLLLHGCNNIKNNISCDCEQVYNDMFTGETVCQRFEEKGFNNINTRTDQKSKSGKYSIKLTKDNLYGMTYIIKNVIPKEHFYISIWRHHSNKNGMLVASGEKIQDLFLIQKQSNGVTDGEWEQLTLDFIIPESMNGKSLKIFAFHAGDPDPVFFDDLTIKYIEKEAPIKVVEKSSFIDQRDKQKYEIVKIGEDWWMAENLNFKIGDSSLCYENKDDYCDEFGKLYTYNTAIKACPNGWRLPTDNDWKNLEKKLGMTKQDADKYGFRGYDESMALRCYGSAGFNLKLAGAYADGFYNLNLTSYFWTSTEIDKEYAYCREIGHGLTIGRFKDLKQIMHFSVRCIKNQ